MFPERSSISNPILQLLALDLKAAERASASLLSPSIAGGRLKKLTIGSLLGSWLLGKKLLVQLDKHSKKLFVEPPAKVKTGSGGGFFEVRDRKSVV